MLQSDLLEASPFSEAINHTLTVFVVKRSILVDYLRTCLAAHQHILLRELRKQWRRIIEIERTIATSVFTHIR